MRKRPRPLGYHFDRKDMVRRADGKRACRWCKGPVLGRRRNYCSDPCVSEWRFRTDNSYMRAAIFERDQGVCRFCGLDTTPLDASLVLGCLNMTARAAALATQAWRAWPNQPPLDRAGNLHPISIWCEALARAYEWHVANRLAPEQPPWQVDHIRPIRDGGDWFDRRNLATACVPCHRRKTAAENAARSKKGARLGLSDPAFAGSAAGSHQKTRRSRSSGDSC